jgi:hypothetical protein
MDIFEANKYAKAYAPHVYTIDGEHGCYGSECGDTVSENDIEVFVIKMDENLTHTEWEIQASGNQN